MNPNDVADTSPCDRCGESREAHVEFTVNEWDDKYILCPAAYLQISKLADQVYDEPEDPRTVC